MNYNETIEKLENLANQVSNMEMQTQAVLSIVGNLEDKYENITSLGALQEAEMERLIDKKIKAMEAKYNKLFESKLKLLDSNIKTQEKIMRNRNEIKQYSETVRKENESNTRYQVPVQKQNYNSNIYSKINVKEEMPSQVAEPVYNQNLEDMLNKLKNTKIDTKRLTKSINNINPILGYTNKEDADY